MSPVRFVNKWNESSAFIFAISVCSFYWALSIAGSFGPQIKLAIPGIQFAITSKFVLLMAAPLLLAVLCIVLYAGCRASLKKVDAHWGVYLLAVTVGLALPFASYFGSHYSSFPWGRTTELTIVRVSILNLCLSPLWEEIIWRGCFFKKAKAFSSTSRAIVLSSVAWTIWHGGFIAYLYSEGIPIRVLSILPLLYFCMGILLCSVFEMGRGSLWPCVLLHAVFNASTLVYYQSYDRISEFSSYVAELVVTAIVAASLFIIAIRRANRDSSQQSKHEAYLNE